MISQQHLNSDHEYNEPELISFVYKAHRLIITVSCMKVFALTKKFNILRKAINQNPNKNFFRKQGSVFEVNNLYDNIRMQ